MNNKVLFVLAKASTGGSCTSMLNLLELLKERGYFVDLFLMTHEGEFLSRAKSASNLLPECCLLASIVTSKNNIRNSKSLIKLLIRVLYVILHKLFGAQVITSLFYKKSANYLSNKYNTVVAFQESMTTEFVHHIKAAKKVAWVHTDFHRFADGSEVFKFYDSFEKIICVSKSVEISVLGNIENAKNKTELIYNSLVINKIINGSSVELDFLKRGDAEIVLVSVGRFVKAKGFERIVDIAIKLREDHIKFIWYVVGDGELWEAINLNIMMNNLGSCVVLLGNMDNPYPVIKFANFMVLTSLYEAHPMVVNEALILHKPIISASFNSVNEIMVHGVTGLICENSTSGVYEGIKKMVVDKELRESIQYNVDNFKYSNDEILLKVKQLLFD